MTSGPLQPFARNRLLHGILAAYAFIFLATAIAPRDRLTWVLENILVVLGIGVMALTYRRFAFSNASYLLIGLYLGLHAVGTQTGYMHAPAGDWLRDTFGLSRNPYDRIVHCAFGLLLAYPLHELLVRVGGIRGSAAYWLPAGIILALGSGFESIEAAVAHLADPAAGPAWLGAQGDEWDAQFDMSAALVGAAFAMLLAWTVRRGKNVAKATHPPRVPMPPFRERRLLQALCLAYAFIWIVAAIHPVKRDDWLIENILVFAAMPALFFTYRRLPLSDPAYVLIFLFLVLHAAGAHYTYSEVPLGYWIKETVHLQRNHFDRLVHLSFGLLLTYPLREIFIRVLQPRPGWTGSLAATMILAFGGFFEIIEGLVARVVNPELGAAYLGTQGDVWDAQKDMALALFGAALVILWTMWRDKRGVSSENSVTA
jgi:putative membrane protein